MSSTPTLERPTLAPSNEDWVDVAPSRPLTRYSSTNVVLAIARARDLSHDAGIVVETESFRPVDEEDVDAAQLASQRWDS